MPEVLEIPMPPTDERDMALGRFMSSWSEMESMLRELLSVLSGANQAAAYAIAAAVPDLGRAKDLLLALGEATKLNAEEMKELEGICDHLMKSGQFRNTIVHGRWIYSSTDMIVDGKHLVHGPEWLRVYAVIGREKERNAVIGMNEGDRTKFVFSLTRLDERSVSARKLGARMYTLSKLIRDRYWAGQ